MKPIRLITYVSVIVAILFGPISKAWAVLNIEITQAADTASPIAIVPFHWPVASETLPEDIAAIVAADLHRSGQFRPIPTADMLAQPYRGQDILFDNWRILNIEHLTIGRVRKLSANQYQVDVQLFDVIKQRQLLGRSFKIERQHFRRLAHTISDMIYQQLTGEQGAFNTRIAYITAVRDGQQPLYRLEVSDADGYNPRTILRSSAPIMSPSWAPDAQRLSYVSFENKRPEIFVHKIATAEREKIAAFNGINGAPVWSPDGRRLALTLSHKGNPDIYILTLANKQLQQITRSWAIDTEPVWTPDGNALIFTSGRSGGPQLYQIDLREFANSGKASAKRLTFEGEYNASPAISPDGRSLAMVHRHRGKYQIAVLDLRSRLFRIITAGYLDESPSFAPNGSMLLYASQQHQRGVLAAVAIDGRTQQRLSLSDGDVREPTWAPFSTDKN